MDKLIVLDVDGVCANTYQSKIDMDMAWEVEGHLGHLAHEWWENLIPYPWVQELYQGLLSTGIEVLIATALNPDYHAAYSGRAAWIQKHLKTNNFLIGPPKTKLSMPGRLLVDDSRPTCDGWEKKGGKAIRFPRLWHDEVVEIPKILQQAKDLLNSM